jgi:GNAT superfamily N-acetyltransferase
MTSSNSALTIRPGRPAEYEALGKMLVAAYAALPGMPSSAEQPDYYAMLANVGARAAKPALTVFVVADPAGKLLGCIDFIDDMTQYGSGGTASTVTDAAGVRLLAVEDAARGKGVGKALTLFCIDRAPQDRQTSPRAAHDQGDAGAWAMYEGRSVKAWASCGFPTSTSGRGTSTCSASGSIWPAARRRPDLPATKRRNLELCPW